MSTDTLSALYGLGALGGFVIVLIIIGIFALAAYVLTAYPLYKILKAVHYELAWLAWIPFCQYFTIVMAFNYKNEPNMQIFGLSVPRPAAGFASLIGIVLSKIIPIIGNLFPILAVLINGCILAEMYDVCEDHEPGSNLAMGIISSLIWIVQIVMLFKYMGRANRGEINIDTYSAMHP